VLLGTFAPVRTRRHRHRHRHRHDREFRL